MTIAGLGALVVLGWSSTALIPTRPATATAASDRELAAQPVVAVITSYDESYDWERQISASIRATLGSHASAVFHRMETLGIFDLDSLDARGQRARDWIRTVSPAAVIVTDDNAWKYAGDHLAREYHIPVVFCGVNWPAAGYDFLRPNVHGMVETSPSPHVLDLLEGVLPSNAEVTIIGVDRPTDKTMAMGFVNAARSRGFEPGAVLVSDFEQWCDAFRTAHETSDFVYVLNNAGISDWDDARARRVAAESSRALSATEYDWMSPFALISANKRGEEQGAWASGEVLNRLRHPNAPAGPIVVNQEMLISINEDLFERTGLGVPTAIRLRAEDPS